MDFIFASEVSRTINASLTNGRVSLPLQALVAITLSPESHGQQCHGCGAGSISSRASARDTGDSNEDVAEVRANQQHGSPETASAADVISEAEDEAPIMEALLLSGENARMVTVEGDGNCLPRALAIACQDSRSYQEIRRATCDHVVKCWAGLGWPHLTNEGAAKLWATKCRIDGEWLEADFISAYCHMRRINVTLAMLDWRVAESGRRVPYLSKQLMIGGPAALQPRAASLRQSKPLQCRQLTRTKCSPLSKEVQRLRPRIKKKSVLLASRSPGVGKDVLCSSLPVTVLWR